MLLDKFKQQFDGTNEKLSDFRRRLDNIRQIIVAMLQPLLPDAAISKARLKDLRERVGKSVEGVDAATIMIMLQQFKTDATARIADSIDKEAIAQQFNSVKAEGELKFGQVKERVDLALVDALPELTNASPAQSALREKLANTASNAVIALLVTLSALAALTALSLAFAGVASVAAAAQALADFMFAIWTSASTLSVGAIAATVYVGKPYMQLKIAQVEEQEDAAIKHILEDAVRAKLGYEKITRAPVSKPVESVVNEVVVEPVKTDPDQTLEESVTKAPLAAVQPNSDGEEWETDLNVVDTPNKHPRLRNTSGSM